MESSPKNTENNTDVDNPETVTETEEKDHEQNNDDNQKEIEKTKSENTFIKDEEKDMKMDMAEEYEAYNLCRKARQITTPSCCLISVFQSKKSRKLEAFYLYNKAGIKYKSCKNWKKAGECFEECADIKTELNESPLDSYRESYFCYEQCEDKEDNNDVGNKDSNRLFNTILQYLTTKGEFYEAAKLCEEIAEKNEEKKKFNDAINFYSKAAEYYSNDNKHNSKKNNCFLKYAELLFMYDDTKEKEKVPEILEKVAKEYLKAPLTKYAAKEVFGKVLLIIIFNSKEISEADIYLNKYKETDETFEESSICALCKGVIEAYEEKNYEKLKKSIKDYKSICDVDNFMADIFTKLLEKLKKNENNDEDLK